MNAMDEEEQSSLTTDEETSALLIETAMSPVLPSTLAVEPQCPKCTDRMVLCQVGHVAIYGWWLEREIRPAGALGPPRTLSTDVVARMCIRCGFTELYAVEPAALLTGGDLH